MKEKPTRHPNLRVDDAFNQIATQKRATARVTRLFNLRRVEGKNPRCNHLQIETYLAAVAFLAAAVISV